EDIDPCCDPFNPKSLDYEQILAAQQNIKDTGSFKARGARNALMRLAEEERKNGVFIGSTRNFARATAYHGKDLGIPVTVVLPRYSTLTTIATCEHYGANVVIQGKTHEESMKAAFKLARESGGKFINGHDHIDIMAGAGTIALEILEESTFFLTRRILADMVDGVVAIREGSLALGILKMFEQEKIVLEGAGAIGPAALLAGNIEGLAGKRVACILSGGNIESSMIGQTIEKGLAIDNRLIQVRVTMPDMVGGFAELFEIFARNGSSVKEFLT
ncbi:pyridoxal-phosphate dependent protein, partial [Teladorsagia circumcincta]